MAVAAEAPVTRGAAQTTGTKEARPRVLSGVKPSGNLHLGNYLGAIKRWVDEQEQFDSYFCIVDLHAITVYQDPKKLRQYTRELAAFYFAAGLDPQKCTVFVQSHIPAHAELAWLLNCVTPMGWLEKMTQFKDKAAKLGTNDERISTGLFDYPVLMAADIFLYQARYVPVGDDQRQHVELARDLAERFNRLYGDTFTVPEAVIGESGARIMGLEDPTEKMSKSDEKPNQAIGIYDDPAEIRKKVMRATTDSLREIRFDPERKGIYNLLTIYQALTGESRETIEARFARKGYGDFKKALAEVVVDSVAPIQARCKELLASDELDRLLRTGAEKASVVANETLRHAKYAMGFTI